MHQLQDKYLQSWYSDLKNEPMLDLHKYVKSSYDLQAYLDVTSVKKQQHFLHSVSNRFIV